MRKGELFALQKSDIDFAAGLIRVSRSHDRAMRRAGIVTGYVHKCRRKGASS